MVEGIFGAVELVKGFGIVVDSEKITIHRFNEPGEVDGIYLLSVPDILAMKLNAISISGHRVKDFVDFYFALKEYSIFEMLQFYQKKILTGKSAHVLKSLIYFDDVNWRNWPIMIEEPKLEWSDVKEEIEKKVLAFIKNGS